MPRHVVLVNWTDQGIKSFRSSVDRYEAARTALHASGIEFVDIHWTIGAYDLVAVIESPDDETLAGCMLALAAPGNLRTTTMRAFSADEMRAVIAKAG
jgi:uncharacterized protein with GYD domain